MGWWSYAKKIARIAVGIIPFALCRPQGLCSIFSKPLLTEAQKKIAECIAKKSTTLRLRDLSKIPQELLQPHAFTFLTTLNLAKNKHLTEIPEELFSLPNTCTIDLKGCPLSEKTKTAIQEKTQNPDYQGPKIHYPGFDMPKLNEILAHASPLLSQDTRAGILECFQEGDSSLTLNDALPNDILEQIFQLQHFEELFNLTIDAKTLNQMPKDLLKKCTLLDTLYVNISPNDTTLSEEIWSIPSLSSIRFFAKEKLDPTLAAILKKKKEYTTPSVSTDYPFDILEAFDRQQPTPSSWPRGLKKAVETVILDPKTKQLDLSALKLEEIPSSMFQFLKTVEFLTLLVSSEKPLPKEVLALTDTTLRLYFTTEALSDNFLRPHLPNQKPSIVNLGVKHAT